MQTQSVLSLDEIESQAAFELPARETMLVTVIITDVLNNLSVDVDVRNNNVAVQVCAAVSAIASLINQPLTCEVAQ